MGSPVGISSFTTSAPQSARMPPADGPATHRPISTTRMPDEQARAHVLVSRPVNTGGRFSMNARGPSFASSVAAFSFVHCDSIANASSSGRPLPRTIASFDLSSATGAPRLMRRAKSSAVGEHLLRRHDAIDEADGERVLRRDRLADEHQFHRLRPRHLAREPRERPAAGDEAASHFGERDRRLARHDADVGAQQELGAAGMRVAVDRDHDRLVERRIAQDRGAELLAVGGEALFPFADRLLACAS